VAGNDVAEEADIEARLVFRDATGRELTTADLAGFTGQVRWELVGGEAVPPEAAGLHRQARQAGEQADYDRAIRLLDEAHRLAPNWPYPVYDAAFTYLLQDDVVRAEQHYAEVDRLAPRGFFTCKTSLWSLRRELAGELPAGFSKAYATLEWVQDPAEKRAILQGIVGRFPDHAPAWKDLAVLLEDPEACLEAVTRGLAANPDDETKGVLLIRRAIILHERGQSAEAVQILGELALDPSATFANESIAKYVLGQISGA
jgi:tetratricopeptide (TPR) repeat protein